MEQGKIKVYREIKFDRYKNNCCIEQTQNGDFVKSYETRVAKIDYDKELIIVFGWWSQTTSKHINYVAQELGYFGVIPADEYED